MSLLLRTSLSVVLLPALAHAQLLVPLAQDRYVSGTADADDFVTFLSDSDLDQSPDFSPYVATASASVTHPDATACGGGNQNTQIGSSSFSGVGSAFSDTQVSLAPWLAEATCASVATLDFRVDTKVRFRLVGTVSGLDSGIAVADLKTLAGVFIAGDASLFQGPVGIDEVGTLDPGDYRVSYRAFGDTVSNGGGFDFSFSEFDMLFELTPLAVNYCSAGANSAGPGTLLSLGGTTSLAANDFRVDAAGVPSGVFGLAFYGPDQVQVPFGDGFRCVGGQAHRLQPPVQAGGGGLLSKPIDLTAGPPSSGSGEILPTSTWNFQLWYRDPMGPGGTGFNTSDGLAVTFCR